MKRGVFIVLILVITIFIFSIGMAQDETIVNDDNSDESDATISETTNAMTKETPQFQEEETGKIMTRRKIISSLSACEAYGKREARIKCKIKAMKVYSNDSSIDKSDLKTIPEPCRRLSFASDGKKISKDKCQALLQEVNSCKRLTDNSKLSCFRKASGLGKAGADSTTDKTKIRLYMITLLDHLATKIQSASENGKIEVGRAANLIDLIIQIQEKLLAGETKKDISPLINELRKDLKDMRQFIDG